MVPAKVVLFPINHIAYLQAMIQLISKAHGNIKLAMYLFHGVLRLGSH